MEKILQTIRDNVVTTLNLSRKNISNNDLARIAEALKSNTSITRLFLNWNKLTDPSSLAEVLKSNTTLTELELCGNQIKDLSSLAKMLTINTTLTALDLSGNKIKDPSSLAKALTTNTILTDLYFSTNTYRRGRDVLEAIRGSLSLNRDNSRIKRSTLFVTMFNALAGSALQDDFSQ